MKKNENFKKATSTKKNNEFLLTREEEIELFKIIEASKKENATMREKILGGDAINRILIANMGLIVSVSRNYKHSMSMEEILQYGSIGLTKAIKTYDYRKAKFSTHANYWILQEIKRSIDNRDRIIRIPTKNEDKIRLIGKTKKDLANKLGREPILDEIIQELKGKIKEKDIKELLAAAQSIKSLDQDVFEDTKEIDLIKDEGVMDPNEYASKTAKIKKMNKFLNSLPKIDRKIFELSYGIYDENKRTQIQIAKELGISLDKVRKSIIESEALLKKFNIKL